MDIFAQLITSMEDRASEEDLRFFAMVIGAAGFLFIACFVVTMMTKYLRILLVASIGWMVAFTVIAWYAFGAKLIDTGAEMTLCAILALGVTLVGLEGVHKANFERDRQLLTEEQSKPSAQK